MQGNMPPGEGKGNGLTRALQSWRCAEAVDFAPSEKQTKRLQANSITHAHRRNHQRQCRARPPPRLARHLPEYHSNGKYPPPPLDAIPAA